MSIAPVDHVWRAVASVARKSRIAVRKCLVAMRPSFDARRVAERAFRTAPRALRSYRTIDQRVELIDHCSMPFVGNAPVILASA
jgi:hypothetical protein